MMLREHHLLCISFLQDAPGLKPVQKVRQHGGRQEDEKLGRLAHTMQLQLNQLARAVTELKEVPTV